MTTLTPVTHQPQASACVAGDPTPQRLYLAAIPALLFAVLLDQRYFVPSDAVSSWFWVTLGFGFLAALGAGASPEDAAAKAVDRGPRTLLWCSATALLLGGFVVRGDSVALWFLTGAFGTVALGLRNHGSLEVRRRARAVLPVLSLGMLAGGLSLGWAFAEPWVQHWRTPAPFATLLAEVLGLEVHTDRSLVAVLDGRTFALGTGPRAAELFTAVAMFVLLAPAVHARRGVLGCAVLLVGCELLRETLVLTKLIGLASGWADETLWARSLWLLPLLAVTFAVSTVAWLGRLKVLQTSDRSSRFVPVPMVAVLLGCFLLVAGTLSHPLGKPKSGRVAIDSVHSAWEWTDVPLNRRLFGTKTTYNLFSMIASLRETFPEVDIHEEGALTRDVLERYDVWILKTPTSPYTEVEVAAITDYVSDGGGVWFIGDHTDIFGMNTYLNQVTERMGVRLNPDAAFDLPGKLDKQLWQRPGGATHPVTADVPEFLFATSDTLQASPINCSDLISGTELYSDESDYSKVTFFGNETFDDEEPYGRFHQCVSGHYGSGRFVVFGDSTVYSSFYVHLPGKLELARSTIAWLNHKDSFRGWPQVPRLLGGILLLLGLGVGFVARTKPVVWILCVAVGASTGVLIASAHDALWRLDVPTPKPERPVVGILPGLARHLPLRHYDAHAESDPERFVNFMVALQRHGLVPEIVLQPELLADYDLAIVLAPNYSQMRGVLEVLARREEASKPSWLITNASGLTERVLSESFPEAQVVASPQRLAPPSEESDEFLAYDTFGPQVNAADRLHGVSFDVPHPAFLVEGGERLLTVGKYSAHTVLSSGSGTLALTSVPDLWSNLSLGSETAVPTRERFFLHEIIWRTVDTLLGRPPCELLQIATVPPSGPHQGPIESNTDQAPSGR